MFKQKILTLAVRLGLTQSSIFGSEPPYPNPYGFETTEKGIPIVPQDKVKKPSAIFSGSSGDVFGGHEIVSTSQKNVFINRVDMGAKSVREGDLFAFKNKNPDRPALVYEVVESGSRGIRLQTQDIGYLERSV